MELQIISQQPWAMDIGHSGAIEICNMWFSCLQASCLLIQVKCVRFDSVCIPFVQVSNTSCDLVANDFFFAVEIEDSISNETRHFDRSAR